MPEAASTAFLPKAMRPAALPLMNIGAGKDISIGELARVVAEVVGFKGRLVFDASKPDGTPRKLLDSGRLDALGWRASVSLREGLGRAYRLYCEGAGPAAARSAA